MQKDSAASLEAVSAEPVETVPDTEDGKKAKAADQLGTEDEQDKKKPGKRPSFARRPVPMTAPASDRWHAIRNVFKEHVQPKILSAGGTVYCWEERVAVIKSDKTFCFNQGCSQIHVLRLSSVASAPGALVQLCHESLCRQGC